MTILKFLKVVFQWFNLQIYSDPETIDYAQLLVLLCILIDFILVLTEVFSN